MDRKAMGLDHRTGEDPKKKEIMPGLRALRQKRALMINQPEVVSSNFKSDIFCAVSTRLEKKLMTILTS